MGFYISSSTCAFLAINKVCVCDAKCSVTRSVPRDNQNNNAIANTFNWAKSRRWHLTPGVCYSIEDCPGFVVDRKSIGYSTTHPSSWKIIIKYMTGSFAAATIWQQRGYFKRPVCCALTATPLFFIIFSPNLFDDLFTRLFSLFACHLRIFAAMLLF